MVVIIVGVPSTVLAQDVLGKFPPQAKEVLGVAEAIEVFSLDSDNGRAHTGRHAS